jgi:hypothetical protein
LSTDIDPFFDQRHENLSKNKQYKRIFQPFWVSYSKADVPDCFFYPQRLIVGLSLGAISVIYMAIQSIQYIGYVCDKIYELYLLTNDAYLFFLGGALNSFKNEFPGNQFDENSYKQIGVVITFLSEQALELSRAVRIAFTYSG